MSIVMLALAGSGLAASMDEEWKNYWSKWQPPYLNHPIHPILQVSGKSLGDVLKPMIDYNFTLPPYALKRGYVYRGHAARLRRMARDLLEGEKTVVASATATGLHKEWIGANMVVCLDMSADHGVGLVSSEFVL
eukprot:gene15649-21756_t